MQLMTDEKRARKERKEKNPLTLLGWLQGLASSKPLLHPMPVHLICWHFKHARWDSVGVPYAW
jgi:hypothetical protein